MCISWAFYGAEKRNRKRKSVASEKCLLLICLLLTWLWASPLPLFFHFLCSLMSFVIDVDFLFLLLKPNAFSIVPFFVYVYVALTRGNISYFIFVFVKDLCWTKIFFWKRNAIPLDSNVNRSMYRILIHRHIPSKCWAATLFIVLCVRIFLPNKIPFSSITQQSNSKEKISIN